MRGGTGKLILVSETFHADFADACRKLEQQMLAGAHRRRLTGSYLTITDVTP